MLKYGLDELMQNDDSTIIDEDLKYILTVDALDSDSAATTTPIVKPELPEAEEAAEAAEQETIYEYAGEDYSKKATAKDSDAFENLKKSVVATGLVPAPRKRKPPVQLEPVGLPSTTARHRPRKVMTKEERWAKAGYTSLKLMLDVVDRYSVSDGELQYRQGSVTNPVDVAGTARPIIVHCVDNSGAWTNRGVFRALSELSPRVEEVYTTAGSIKDLHVGDAHLIDLAPGAPVMVALVVAYRRDREGYLSDFLLDDFRRGLEQVASFAVLHNASLHLPRFGLKPDRWYPIERTIRGEVVARGVPAVVYYHPRGGRGDTYGARSVVATSRDAPVVATPRDSTVIATPTDVSTHAETPSTVPATPPIFDDLLIHLYTTPSEKDALADKKHRLTRYIAAYGGDTTDIIQDASHVVVLGDTDAELLAGYLCVRPDWIVDSIKSGQLLSASKYRRIA